MNKDLIAIFDYLEKEKGIKRDLIISAIEESLLVAARKSIHGQANISVQVHAKTGDIEVFAEKHIIEGIPNQEDEISLEEAQQLDPDCEIGQYIDILIPTQDFGRIAAQQARQIITQKLRHAEKDVIYQEYRNRVNEIVSGTVKRFIHGGSNLVVDLGKVEALLPNKNYPKTEYYKIGDRIYSLLLEVRDTDGGGAEVILSRSHPEFIKQLLIQEIPEIDDGTITIHKIVREAGYRTKVLVQSNDMRVDPVGACIGMRGNRIKNVLREINNEKIDIIPYAQDPIQLLQNTLHPINIRKIHTNSDENKISIIVDDEDFPTVVGKQGLNTRLNSKLLGFEIKVWKMSEYSKFMLEQCAKWACSDDPSLDESIQTIPNLSSLIVQQLMDAGYNTLKKILQENPDKLALESGISLEAADKVLEEIRKHRM